MKLETMITDMAYAKKHCKYLLIHEKSKEKVTLYAGGQPSHQDMFDLYEMFFGDYFDMQALGGGIMKINKDAKTISTYGKSLTFGKPNQQLVEDIVAQNFPEYKRNIKVTDQTLAYL